MNCDTWVHVGGRLWLKKAEVQYIIVPHNLEEIPMIEASLDDSGQYQCAICGVNETEFHHIAPKHLADQFGDEWTLWPGIYLCNRHHRQWHSIVTPGMNKK